MLNAETLMMDVEMMQKMQASGFYHKIDTRAKVRILAGADPRPPPPPARPPLHRRVRADRPGLTYLNAYTVLLSTIQHVARAFTLLLMSHRPRRYAGLPRGEPGAERPFTTDNDLNMTARGIRFALCKRAK